MKKKISNFFYYYKYYLLAAVFILLVIAVLLKDSSSNNQKSDYKITIVDDTSKLNLETGKLLMKDFLTEKGLDENDGLFQYRSMYMEKEVYQNVNFEVAGIEDYEDCFSNGTIDLVILSVMDIISYIDGEKSSVENEETETQVEYRNVHDVVMLDEIFSQEELEKYSRNIYYVEEKPVGIVFDTCKKAKEFYGDDYPTDYHYIMQIAQGSKDNEYVKEFIEYLID